MPGWQDKISWFNLLAVTQDKQKDTALAYEPSSPTLPSSSDVYTGSNLKNKD